MTFFFCDVLVVVLRPRIFCDVVRRRAREEEEARNRRKKEREQKRKEKVMEKKRIEEEHRIALNIAKEERKILIAQRKLESIRLLSELIDRVKVSLIFYLAFSAVI